MARDRVDFWQLEVSIVPTTSQPNSSSTTTSSDSADAVVSDSESCRSQLLQDGSSIQPVLPRFAPFSKLPIEIRLMIWGYALPEPQTIELCRRFVDSKFLGEGEAVSDVDDQHGAIPKPSGPVRIGRYTPETTKTATSSSRSFKLPILLRTSKEAREFGLKHYRLIFRESMGLNPLYIDFSRDTLAFADAGALLLFLGMEYIDTEYVRSLSAADIRAVLQGLKHPMLKELRYLAVGNRLSPVLTKILPAFHNLAHISIKENTIWPPYLSELMTRVKDLTKTWQDIASLEGYEFKEPEFEFLEGEFFKRYEFKTAKTFNYFVS